MLQNEKINEKLVAAISKLFDCPPDGRKCYILGHQLPCLIRSLAYFTDKKTGYSPAHFIAPLAIRLQGVWLGTYRAEHKAKGSIAVNR
jgi:hypothetical protein